MGVMVGGGDFIRDGYLSTSGDRRREYRDKGTDQRY